jgi:hypothetical protein
MYHLNEKNLDRLKRAWNRNIGYRGTTKQNVKRVSKVAGVSQKVMYKAYRQGFKLKTQ